MHEILCFRETFMLSMLLRRPPACSSIRLQIQFPHILLFCGHPPCVFLKQRECPGEFAMCTRGTIVNSKVEQVALRGTCFGLGISVKGVSVFVNIFPQSFHQHPLPSFLSATPPSFSRPHATPASCFSVGRPRGRTSNSGGTQSRTRPFQSQGGGQERGGSRESGE